MTDVMLSSCLKSYYQVMIGKINTHKTCILSMVYIIEIKLMKTKIAQTY